MKSTPPTENTTTATTDKTAPLPTHTMMNIRKSSNTPIASTMNNSTPTVNDPQDSHQPTTRQDQESVCLSSLSGTLSQEREEGIPSLNPSKSFLSSGSIILAKLPRLKRVRRGAVVVSSYRVQDVTGADRTFQRLYDTTIGPFFLPVDPATGRPSPSNTVPLPYITKESLHG